MPEAPSSSLLESIALILFNSDGRQIGMATLISPSVALTAEHIVDNHQTYFLSRFSVGDGEGLRTSASVIARDDKVGFAALGLNMPIDEPVPDVLLNSAPLLEGLRWDSVYYSDGKPQSIAALVQSPATKDGPPRIVVPVHLLASHGHGSPLITQDRGGDRHFVGIISKDSVEGAAILVVNMLESPAWRLVAAAMQSDDSSTPRGGDDDPTNQAEVSHFARETPPERIASDAASKLRSIKRRRRAAKFDPEAFQARLSSSSLTALTHANGILRAQGQNKLHMEQLLAGLFLNDGPTRIEFDRVGIDYDLLAEIVHVQVGTRLPPENSYPLPDVLALPVLSTHVEEAFRAALALADGNQSEDITTRHLIRGAFSVSECTLIKYLLDAAVDPERIPLQDPEPPATPRRPTQAGIKSDDPEGEDLLDIKSEVEALCTVLAAKDVKPPISLGLFGDWGSGKSFFMKKMEARFKELSDVARKKGDSAFCENIVQLWFNAWHYMDTNLWASLATEIFDKLAQELARQDALDANIKDPDYERAQLIAQSATATEEVANAERVKREADAKLRASEQQLASIQSGDAAVSARPLDVLREGYRFAVQQPEVREKVEAAENALNQKVKAAAKELNIDRPDAVKEELLELQGILGYLRAIVIAVREAKNKGRWLLGLSAVLGVVAILLWVLPQVIEQEWVQSAWLRISGVGLVILGAIAPFLRTVHRAVQIIHGAVKTNQESIEKARLEAEANLQAKHQGLVGEANDAEKELNDKIKAAALVTRKLESLRADRQITDFIRQRQQSSDYTKYLGVIAKARNDFEQLSTLLAREQGRSAKEREEQRKRKLQAIAGVSEATTQTTDQGPLLPRIDRIILYIDDLDRCPEHKVVDVLQAVHLLLAFPLFIVVVGVDPRWLLHSLRQHSRTFREEIEDETASDEESSHWQATPLNYLEKIFQIPFTLWPMGKSGFGKMVDTLTEPPKPAEKKEESGQTKVEPKVPDQAEAMPKAEQSEVLPVDPEVSTNKVTSVPTEDVSSWKRFVAYVKRSLGIGQEPEAKPAAVESTTAEANAAPVPRPTPEEPARDAGNTAEGQPDGGHATSEQTTAAIDPNPEHLQIEPWERAFMKELHQLIPSPRATKRFINIYRLIRAAVDLDERLALEEFIGNEKQGKYRAALLLLAILTGYPDQATEILRELVENKHTETWWQFVDSFKGRAEIVQVTPAGKAAANGKQTVKRSASAKKGGRATETDTQLRGSAAQETRDDGSPDARIANVQRDAEAWAELLEILGSLRHRIEPTQSCDDFVEWAPKVARYSFQSGRVLLTRGANPRI